LKAIVEDQNPPKWTHKRSGSGTRMDLLLTDKFERDCRQQQHIPMPNQYVGHSSFIHVLKKMITFNQYLVSLGLSSMLPQLFLLVESLHKLSWFMNGLDSHLSLLDIFWLRCTWLMVST